MERDPPRACARARDRRSSSPSRCAASSNRLRLTRAPAAPGARRPLLTSPEVVWPVGGERFVETSPRVRIYSRRSRGGLRSPLYSNQSTFRTCARIFGGRTNCGICAEGRICVLCVDRIDVAHRQESDLPGRRATKQRPASREREKERDRGVQLAQGLSPLATQVSRSPASPTDLIRGVLLHLAARGAAAKTSIIRQLYHIRFGKGSRRRMTQGHLS